MKKSFTLLSFVFLVLSASAQKDLSVRLTLPATDTFAFDPGQNFDFSYVIKNVGTDTVPPGDTIYTYMKMDKSLVMGSILTQFVPTSNFLPGDSVEYLRSFIFTYTINYPFEFCIEISATKNEVQTDVNLANNKSCKTLIHLTGSGTDKIAKDRLKLYPNPATNDISINYPGTNATKAIFTDITGRQIMNIPLANGTGNADVSVLPKGIYMAAVYTADGELLATEKIVVAP